MAKFEIRTEYDKHLLELGENPEKWTDDSIDFHKVSSFLTEDFVEVITAQNRDESVVYNALAKVWATMMASEPVELRHRIIVKFMLSMRLHLAVLEKDKKSFDKLCKISHEMSEIWKQRDTSSEDADS